MECSFCPKPLLPENWALFIEYTLFLSLFCLQMSTPTIFIPPFVFKSISFLLQERKYAGVRFIHSSALGNWFNYILKEVSAFEFD